MKVVATNIFDFATWYKFGFKTVPGSMVIDLSASALTGDELLAKTGFFEEEYEVFYLEVKPAALGKKDGLAHLSLYDIDFIIPASETGARLLQSKIPDFKLSEPLDPLLYEKLLTARNDFMAVQGAQHLLSSFGISGRKEYDPLEDSFLQSLRKYKTDLNAAQQSPTDYLVFYERSKPFPLTDQGFLFDAGSVVRVWLGLTDDDFKNRDILKEQDTVKYELVNEVICLSNFLRSKDIGDVWNSFLQHFGEDNTIQQLNNRITLPSITGVNNLLTIALYFKFRDRIRNSRSLADKFFVGEVNDHLAKFPEETKTALLLNGLFFGGLKFRELRYKQVPLSISKHFVRRVEEPVVEQIAVEAAPEVMPEAIPEVTPEATVKPTVPAESDFDNLWELLKSVVKKYSKEQKATIKKAYDKVKKGQPNPLDSDSKEQLFINGLKKQITNAKLEEASRLSDKIVEEIAECISVQAK